MKRHTHIQSLLYSLVLIFLAIETDASQGTVLAEGLITTFTNVDHQANLSLDLRDIKVALLQDPPDIEKAKYIYVQGKHSLYDPKNDPSLLRSLFKIGTTDVEFVSQRMKEPTYLMQIHGLAQGHNVDAKNMTNYADSFIVKALEQKPMDSKQGMLVYEAGRALHVWMYAVHELHDLLSDCRANYDVVANNPEYGMEAGLHRNSNAAQALDEFIAYYIGANQKPGDSFSGSSLYSLAQEAAELFGTKSNGFEADVNSIIIQEYFEARAVLAFSSACTGSQNDIAMEKLYRSVNRIITSMQIPLIQMLIANLRENSRERIKLYATAIIPHMYKCGDTRANSLTEKLLSNDFEYKDFLQVIQMIQSMYECLGITCDQVGAYKVSQVPRCADLPADYPIADYIPSSSIRQVSKIDIDIREIEILAHYDARTAIEMYYTYGKNAIIYANDANKKDKAVSLKSLATSNGRSLVSPWFKYFKDYHESTNYASEAFYHALNKDDKWKDASEVQVAAALVGILKTQVIFMAGLENFYSAHSKCKLNAATSSTRKAVFDTSSIDAGKTYWDKGVALFIGSLEGPYKGGSSLSDGQMFFNLAKRFCKTFDVCRSDYFAVYYNREVTDAFVNEKLLELFKSGNSQYMNMECETLLKTIQDIQSHLLIPLVQGMDIAAELSQSLETGSTDVSLALGDIYASSLIPLVHHYDDLSAFTLESNMEFQLNRSPVSDGIKAVRKAIENVAKDLGLRCGYLYRRGYMETSCEYWGNESGDGVEKNTALWFIALTIPFVAMIFIPRFINNKWRKNGHAHREEEDDGSSSGENELQVNDGTLA